MPWHNCVHAHSVRLLAVPWPSINGSVHGDEVASLSLDAVDGALPALQNEHAEQDTSKLSEVQCARAVALVEAATYIPLEACYDLYHDSTHVTTQQSQGTLPTQRTLASVRHLPCATAQ